MTAHYFARVVESLYNKVDIDKMSAGFDQIKKYDSSGRMSDDWTNRRITEKSYIRWCMAIGAFEQYLRENYATFVETELVYKWGKRICDERNYELTMYRAYGNPFNTRTFKEWLRDKKLIVHNFSNT
jgi:hypothetical protein